MTALPSASKTLRGPGESVMRLVVVRMKPLPRSLTIRFGRSPMWKGWFASTGALLDAGPGSKWLPAAPYAGAASDSLVVYSGRSDGLRATACCGPGGGCGTCSIRSGGETCMASSPVGAIVDDDVVAYVNSTLGVACAQNVDAAPQQTRLMSSGGVAGYPAPSGSDFTM